MNEAVYAAHPDVVTIAEESTAWPMVSRPVYVGGLGFGLKWDMGWMHDTLTYFAHDPVHRQYHQHELTFRAMYAFHENFMLPLSHDEVVYGKRSLLGKMPGDEWQRFANLRLLFALMFAQPGKKLLFMGAEFAQPAEWTHDGQLAWSVAGDRMHAGVQPVDRPSQPHLRARSRPPRPRRRLTRLRMDRRRRRRTQRAGVCAPRGGRGASDRDRLQLHPGAATQPPPRRELPRLVSRDRQHRRKEYGGSGQGNMGGIEATPAPHHGRPYSLNVTLPPLAAVFLKRD